MESIPLDHLHAIAQYLDVADVLAFGTASRGCMFAALCTLGFTVSTNEHMWDALRTIRSVSRCVLCGNVVQLCTRIRGFVAKSCDCKICHICDRYRKPKNMVGERYPCCNDYVAGIACDVCGQYTPCSLLYDRRDFKITGEYECTGCFGP